MRIAIAGAGICGAYLYRRLINEGHSPDLYDVKDVNTSCGIASCAWLAPNPQIFEYTRKVGLTGHKYILESIEKMVFAGVELKVKMVTIDKPGLISDLVRGDRIREGSVGHGNIDKFEYDMVIDATGTARAYLGRTTPGPNDIIGDGIQIRARVKNYPSGTAHIIPVQGGYLWVFPIGDNQVHAGIATHTPQNYKVSDITERIEPIVWSKFGEEHKIHALQCTCRSKVRITGLLPPFYTQGLIVESRFDKIRCASIYGVGEAIGAVSPLTGEGIVPGLQSCEVFLEHLQNNTLNLYSDDINSKFMWIYHERAVLDHVMKTGKVSGWSFPVLRRMLKRCNCRAPIWSLLKISRKMKS